MLTATRRIPRRHLARRRRLGDLIPGGRAAGRKPRDFDPLQLCVGTLIELEHTRPTDFRVSREIAMDHLTEDGRYYTGLCKLHFDKPCRLFREPALRRPCKRILAL